MVIPALADEMEQFFFGRRSRQLALTDAPRKPPETQQRRSQKTLDHSATKSLVKNIMQAQSRTIRDAQIGVARGSDVQHPDFQTRAADLRDLLENYQRKKASGASSSKRKAEEKAESPNATPVRSGLDAQGLTHADGLDKSYAAPTRMWRSPTNGLYVAGSSRPQDFLDDAMLAMSWDVRNTIKYQEVKAEIKKNKPPYMIADSLGGAVCDVLGKEFNIPVLTYGNPMPTWMTGNNRHIRNNYDLVSVLDGFTTGQHTDADHWWNPHDYHNNARKYRDGELDLHDEDI